MALMAPLFTVDLTLESDSDVEVLDSSEDEEVRTVGAAAAGARKVVVSLGKPHGCRAARRPARRPPPSNAAC